MSTRAEQAIEKVTEKLEKGDDELLGMLRRMVTRANGSADPDLEQEVFLKVLEVFRSKSSIRHPRALMHKIVHDLVVDAWRKRARASARATDGLVELTEPHMEEQIDHNRRLRRLRASILELSCDIRGPVYLFYVEHYTIDRIVRVFGKSPSAVKMALHRGRLQLKRRLSGPE